MSSKRSRGAASCIHAVSSIDEALELLTGVPAGIPDENGHYAPDTINGKVHDRLKEIASRLRESQIPPRDASGQFEFPERVPPAS